MLVSRLPVPASSSGSDLLIRPADEPILRALLRYHLLTVPQIQRLCYSRGALKHAYARSKRLADGNHIQALDMLRPARRGSGPIVYTLAASGLAHLKAMGVEIAEHFRLAEMKKYSYLFLDHWVGLSDVLVAATLLARAEPGVQIETMIHDRELKHRPVLVTVNGRRVGIVPDGWVTFLLESPTGGRVRAPVAWEVDRGTVERRDWQAKILAYLAGYGHEGNGPLLTAFGAHSLTVAVITAGDDGRQQELLAWTEAVLVGVAQPHLAELFQFSSLCPARVQARDFFRNGWRQPFESKRSPLLPLPPRSEDG
jgi:Replication-relaxation